MGHPDRAVTGCAAFDGMFAATVPAPGEAALALHRAFREAVRFGPCERPVRRPSMCHDGTPVIYSVKVGAAVHEAHRVLVEPGSLQHPVSTQVALSLTVADRLLGTLGWRDAAPGINTITQAVFAGQDAVADRWWGGVWLGASIPSAREAVDAPELRLYLNLRNGAAADRWRRLHTVLHRLSTAPAGGDASAWAGAVHPHATPVGLAIVVASGRVRGVRVYTAVAREALPAVAAAANASPAQCARLDQFQSGFHHRFAGAAAVTVGCDFRLTEAGLVPAGRRIKLDLCCQHVPAGQQAGLMHWIEGTLATMRLDGSALERFAQRLRTAWGGFDVDYVGLGFDGDDPQLTVYAKPVA